MKIVTINIFSLLCLALISSCGDGTGKQVATEVGRLQVETYKVVPEPFNNEIISTADLIANEQLSIIAPISGQVLEIYFNEGQKINKGEPIIRLDDRSWKAQLIGIKAELDAAEKDYERKKILLEIEGSSQEEVDQTYSTVETLKSQLQQLQLNIDIANVSAPFSGILGMRNFSKGAYLRVGDEITSLTELNHLKVDFTLPQEYLNDIKTGKTVRVIIGNDTLEANVYAINPLINAQSRTLNIRALLQQTTGKTIMPGTFAEVLVTTNFIKDALLIPTQAIVPEMDKQTVYLFKSGKAIKKDIQMGNRSADKVHILHGINPGDTIITTGLLQIKDGMTITQQLTNQENSK